MARDRELDYIHQALATTRGVLLTGEWGVGKSRLLQAALERAAATGARTLRVSGAVPVGSSGSLAECLEDRIAEDGSREEPPLVLGLDDAHLVDPVVAASLYALVRGGRVRLVASALSGVALPPGMSMLWVERLVERLDVPHFARTGAAKVLRARLADSCPPTRWNGSGRPPAATHCCCANSPTPGSPGARCGRRTGSGSGTGSCPPSRPAGSVP